MRENAPTSSPIGRKLFIAAAFTLATLFLTTAFAQTPIKDDGITGPIHQKFAGKIAFLKENLAKEQVTEAKIVNEFTLGDLIYFRVYMTKSMMNALLEKNPSIDQADAVKHANFVLVFSLNGGKGVETTLDFGTDPTEKKQWTSWRGSLKHTRETGILGMSNFRQFLAEVNLTKGKHNVKLTIFPAYKGTRGEPTTGEFTLNVVNALDPTDSQTCLPRAGSSDPEIERMFVQTYTAKAMPGVPSKAVITSDLWTVERNRISQRIEKRKSSGVVAVNAGGECSFQFFWLAQDHNGAGYGAPYFSLVGDKTKINCACLK
jgi:hypothetical protein